MRVLGQAVPISDTREWLLTHGVKIGVILLVAFILLGLARLAVRRMQRRLEAADSATQELNLQRTATLTQALSYMIRITVLTVTVLLLLGEFDIQLGPLIAGAGIVGVALGFGAQSLVKDFLSGFFILLENQFGVSDVITVNVAGQSVTGKVEALSLRTTQVRSFDGTLHVIPNGNILLIGNTSRGWARAIVDVRVAYEEDVDRVRGVLEELFEELKSDEQLRDSFFSGPDVLGVERFGDYEVVLRVAGEVRPTRRPDLERELRKRIKQRFDERGIAIPVAPSPSATPREGGTVGP
jgi:small-conductance mechanosensitive channel